MNESPNPESALLELRAVIDEARDKTSERSALVERLLNLIPAFEEMGAGDRAKARTGVMTLAGVRGWKTEACIREVLRELASTDRLRVVDPDERRPGKRPAEGLPEGWEDPSGYCCAESGVWQYREMDGETKEVQITKRPVWISQRWRDVDDGAYHVQLRWPGGHADIGRANAMNTRELVAVAGQGAPVTSSNARGVVQWLEAAEHENQAAIPVSTSIARVGWTRRDGKRLLQGVEWPHLLRAEDGHEQAARAMKPRGTWEKWLEAARNVHRHPIPAVLLAASVGSVLLEATDAAPFVIDLHGHSSQGKTTAMRWAASAWADPSDAGAYILPWNATLAAIEGRAGFLRDLPLFLDDTKKVAVRDREKLTGVVYQWGSGQGKARGKPDGVRKIATWRSVLMSSGEAPLARLAGEHVGLRLRVLPICEQPIPSGDEAVDVIEGLEAWGHIGPRVAEWATRGKRWDSLRKTWEMAREVAQKELGGSPAAGRLAGYLASIHLGTQALVECGVPMPLVPMRNVLLSGARIALSSSDTAAEAWERITAWLIANERRISEQSAGGDSPPQGWIGKVLQSGDLAVSPAVLDTEMRRLGYDPEEILPRWAAVGKCTASPKTVKWMGRSAKMYVLSQMDGWRPKHVEKTTDDDPDR